MLRLIPNFHHFVVELCFHLAEDLRILSVIGDIHQFQWIFVTVKQLPFRLLSAILASRESKTLIVPIYQLVSLIPYSIMCSCVMNRITVHPVAVIRNL